MFLSSVLLSALCILCSLCTAHIARADERIPISTGDPTLGVFVEDIPPTALPDSALGAQEEQALPADITACEREYAVQGTYQHPIPTEAEHAVGISTVQEQPVASAQEEPATDTPTETETNPETDVPAATEANAPVPSDTASAPRALPAATLPGPFDMITNLPSDWWRWSKEAFTVENIPLIAGISILTAMTIITDYETWQPFKKEYERSEFFRFMCDRGVDIGDGKFQFGLAGAFALYGFAFKDDRALRTASQTVEVILACGAVVQLLKHITGRESPFVATTRTGRWDFFPSPIEYHKHVPHYDAFPSGHVATALATLTVIAENYPKEKWIRYIGYPAVGLVAVGLVGQSIHWWSDYPLSIALGYTFGMIVAHPATDDEINSTAVQWTKPSLYMGSLSDGTPTFGLSWRL